MDGHERRLADTENIQREKKRNGDGVEVGKEPAAAKLDGSREMPGPDDRHEEKEDRRGEQHAEINATCPPRLVGARMRDERIGDESQRFVEDEQRQQVA